MTTVADFEFGPRIGRGGFAAVYRCTDKRSGCAVAVKVVDKAVAGGAVAAASAARIVNEIRVHWSLKHPAVVEMLDFFEDDSKVYIVLELCVGGDLYRWLRRRGPASEAEAAAYMGQLLSALAYLHRRGILHRDLKLSNLLLYELPEDDDATAHGYGGGCGRGHGGGQPGGNGIHGYGGGCGGSNGGDAYGGRYGGGYRYG
ncbi:unnamed protein product, partial [Phaeothamnion confervicola]